MKRANFVHHPGSEKRFRIESNGNSQETKVFYGDEDISGNVSQLTFKLDAGNLAEVTLTLIDPDLELDLPMTEVAEPIDHPV